MMLLLYFNIIFKPRLVGGSVLAVESTIMLPHNVKFPFGYKYYVCVSAKAKDCYEHLSPPARCNSIVNRCIRGTNYLVPGMQGMCKKADYLNLYMLYGP